MRWSFAGRAVPSAAHATHPKAPGLVAPSVVCRSNVLGVREPRDKFSVRINDNSGVRCRRVSEPLNERRAQLAGYHLDVGYARDFAETPSVRVGHPGSLIWPEGSVVGEQIRGESPNEHKRQAAAGPLLGEDSW